MNKGEFVKLLSKRLAMSKRKTEEFLNEAKCVLIEILNKGEDVKFSKFGKFKSVETSERICQNPITKRYFFLESRKQIVFKPFKKFKFSIK